MPVVFVTMAVEIAWMIFYYGWTRVWRGLRILGSLPRWEVVREVIDAWKRRKQGGMGKA